MCRNQDAVSVEHHSKVHDHFSNCCFTESFFLKVAFHCASIGICETVAQNLNRINWSLSQGFPIPFLELKAFVNAWLTFNCSCRFLWSGMTFTKHNLDIQMFLHFFNVLFVYYFFSHFICISTQFSNTVASVTIVCILRLTPLTQNTDRVEEQTMSVLTSLMAQRLDRELSVQPVS